MARRYPRRKASSYASMGPSTAGTALHLRGAHMTLTFCIGISRRLALCISTAHLIKFLQVIVTTK